MNQGDLNRGFARAMGESVGTGLACKRNEPCGRKTGGIVGAAGRGPDQGDVMPFAVRQVHAVRVRDCLPASVEL